ncbi:MAG: hypothetical protein K2K68_11000 [Duncaniella sp.]|nr:hypothetical protein [Duncaniella sp.]MDE6582041.1 hypothetical protein [Duncaniella sp.]
MSRYPSTDAPTWVKILIIILLLPVFSTPALLSALPQGHEEWRTIVWCFPFYLLMSGWLAWISYNSRQTVAWILMVLMVLSTAAVWMLVTCV